MTIWKKFRALLAGIELNRRVPRHPAHFWYALLSFFCIPAALVMHGDVRFTVTVTALVLPLSLVVYIPYRYFNILSRMLLNALIFGAGCFWCIYRMKHDIPLDKMMVETLALWSLTFLTAGKSKGYFYLLFIDILLLLYAALLPRLFSLYLTFAGFAVILAILFRNRTGFLSGDMLLAPPRRSFRRTWHFVLLALLTSGVAFYFVFSLIPLTDNGLEGLIPVSFTTERESFAAPELKAWLNSGLNRKNGPEGVETDDNATGDFTQLSRDKKPGGKIVSLPKVPPDVPVVPGNGGSSMGKDLVFRVKSPLKLYYLARLYDFYDGRRWRVSRSLRNNRFRNSEHIRTQQVKLTFSVEKLFSSSLAIPWQLEEFEPQEFMMNVNSCVRHFWGVELKTPPRLPFKFVARSSLPVVNLDEQGSVRPLPWPESSSRRNYLQIPANAVSLRVRQLARSLTAGITSPYAKALALRDFLRNNYRYKLHADRAPHHRESVDYFLFFLGEGHCEYFASALAVLARCAGLPARVATGFSPGNFNTLTGLFEIYEYHAHAWTQIHIPEFGWLTFDATPPSAIVSETYPPGLGRMRDPFGDEWKIRPPELTENTLSYIQRIRMNEERRKQEPGNVEQTISEIAAAGDKLREELNREHKQNVAPDLQKKAVKKGVIDLQALRVRVTELINSFQQSLVKLALYAVSSWARLLTAAGVLILSGVSIFWLLLLFRLWGKMIKLRYLFYRSRKSSDPRRALRSCCRAALMLLALKKRPRRRNQELLEYAASLRPDLAEEAVVIFKLFYRSEYRSASPEKKEAEEAFRHLVSLRDRLKGKERK